MSQELNKYQEKYKQVMLYAYQYNEFSTKEIDISLYKPIILELNHLNDFTFDFIIYNIKNSQNPEGLVTDILKENAFDKIQNIKPEIQEIISEVIISVKEKNIFQNVEVKLLLYFNLFNVYLNEIEKFNDPIYFGFIKSLPSLLEKNNPNNSGNNNHVEMNKTEEKLFFKNVFHFINTSYEDFVKTFAVIAEKENLDNNVSAQKKTNSNVLSKKI